MSTKDKNISSRRGKKYAEKASLITQDTYTISEAVALLPKLSISKFDGSAEIHVHINADTTQADQLVRTTVVLPHGSGKTVRIAAFVPDELVDAAKKAGADIAGNEDLVNTVSEGNIDFDTAVAHPDVMKDLAKVAKTLGQKGLMPNPKAGTVSPDVEKTIEELKKGRIECKMDKNGVIHTVFGKTSFDTKKLEENLEAILQALDDAKPAGIKGEYMKSISVSPSMGPGLKVSR